MNKRIVKILNEIENFGYEAYVVGGYVRDFLMKRNTLDVDICTNATPQILIEIFREYSNKKIKDNSLIIYYDDYDFEITTYRLESNYVNRRPTNIFYTSSLIEDLKRRDFTINTICMNKDGVVIDLLDGELDLANNTLKCVGDCLEKIKEDPLRILRAIRFSVTHGFMISDELKKLIKDNNYLVSSLSGERIKREISKILISDRVIDGFKLLRELDLYNIIDIKYDTLIPCNDLYAMYAQLKISNKIPFTKQELSIINDVKNVIKYGRIDFKSLFDYGLYINTVAALVLGVSNKEVNELYKNLPIKNVKDINISISEICSILEIVPCKKIKEIQLILVSKILSGELNNEYYEIKSFIGGMK